MRIPTTSCPGFLAKAPTGQPGVPETPAIWEEPRGALDREGRVLKLRQFGGTRSAPAWARRGYGPRLADVMRRPSRPAELFSRDSGRTRLSRTSPAVPVVITALYVAAKGSQSVLAVLCATWEHLFGLRPSAHPSVVHEQDPQPVADLTSTPAHTAPVRSTL